MAVKIVQFEGAVKKSFLFFFSLLSSKGFNW